MQACLTQAEAATQRVILSGSEVETNPEPCRPTTRRRSVEQPAARLRCFAAATGLAAPECLADWPALRAERMVRQPCSSTNLRRLAVAAVASEPQSSAEAQADSRRGAIVLAWRPDQPTNRLPPQGAGREPPPLSTRPARRASAAGGEQPLQRAELARAGAVSLSVLEVAGRPLASAAPALVSQPVWARLSALVSQSVWAWLSALVSQSVWARLSALVSQSVRVRPAVAVLARRAQQAAARPAMISGGRPLRPARLVREGAGWPVIAAWAD